VVRLAARFTPKYGSRDFDAAPLRHLRPAMAVRV
jgi:hypothetical protein